MKIVLATPPSEGFACGAGMPPPLGLFYIATAAQKQLGERIKIVDAFSEGLYAEEAAARVLAHQPDIFGLSVMSTNINRGLKLLKMVKQARPTVTTVLGGQHATLAKPAQEIYKFYLTKLFLRWSSLLELLRLIKHNPMVRIFLWGSLKNPSLILQLLKTRYA
jgi:hypothetical protein